jgi:hypothetical protein
MIDIQENVAIEIANAMNTAMDPEALAQMMSSGTSSVPAFEAYLAGLAVGEGTFATQDIYDFLNARDAYLRAIELDPKFAQAYWRLALFWRNQMNITVITSGVTEMAPDELSAQYDDAINNAIEHEKDPISKILYRAHKARAEMKLQQALRLNSNYLEQRPNDQLAQVMHIVLLSELGMYDKLPEVTAEFDKRDGFNQLVTVQSILQLQYSGDQEALGAFVDKAIERFGDNPNVIYQAHRALLWLDDIDGASKVVPIIQASYMPEDSRYLVSLRQACAENRIADAERLHANAGDILVANPSIEWLSQIILGNDENAVDVLMEYDAAGDMTTMTSFLGYGIFDASLHPNLLALLQSEGIERGEVIELPYQCRR